jgi:type IV pilus assembly protein PilW
MSLVELMISITIGLLLLAGITTLIAQQSSASGELDKASRQIENGRYAAQVVREDIELAGYFGEFFKPGTPSALSDPCSTATADLDAAVPLPIQGYDSPATVPSPLSACLPDANHVAGTDIVVIRRTDTTTVPVASAVAGQPYMQTGLNVSKALDKVVGTGSDTSVFILKQRDGTVSPLRNYLVHIYYVSPCNIPASGSTCSSSSDGGKPIPTLKRLELTLTGGTAAFSVTPLVEGIENFQVDYGIDTNADGAPDYYTTGTYSTATTPMTATDWANVMAVRINILARNTDSSAGYNDAKTYNLGAAGTVGPFHDAYKRRVFSEIVRLINPSSRRAQ